jgi:spore photoproduct lyase
VVKRFVPDAVWIERDALDTPIARTLRARFAGPVELFDDRPPVGRTAVGAIERPALSGVEGLPASATAGSVHDGKRALVVQRHRGAFLRHCPAGTAGLVCCNYLVVNLASNCPMDCSYCFLQDYLAATPALTAYSNVEDALAEIDTVLGAHPERSFRIGTGELSDSLALDPLTDLSRLLVPFFAARRNAVLELKTKTDCVENLLELDPRGQVVVSWSVNAAAVVERDEPGTATLAERLAAARRVQRAGYRVGFHFDPLIEFDGWEAGYGAAVEAIAAAVERTAIAWVSLGSLRLSPGLAQAVRRRRLAGHALGAELVSGPDGKARVWRGLRLRMYRVLVERLRAALGDVPLYLCMEPAAVWARVMGDVPSDRALGLRLAAGAAW